jgi:hypothetical protein
MVEPTGFSYVFGAEGFDDWEPTRFREDHETWFGLPVWSEEEPQMFYWCKK